jgi:hypothetical protein
MKKYTAIAVIIAGAATSICAAPAIAHGDTGGGWSVTIESQPQPYYYSAPPPPVFYPQSPYVYGPPPSGFAAPPAYQQWPAQPYRDPYTSQNPSWRERESREREGREREWREHDRRDHDRRDHDRRDHQSRDRWQDNDRPGPGARNDLPRWGYGDRHRR